jgi:hypothetical protein
LWDAGVRGRTARLDSPATAPTAAASSDEALHESLKEGARGGSVRSHRARHVLIGTEVALSLVLLMAAGLLLRTLDGLRRASRLDPVAALRSE